MDTVFLLLVLVLGMTGIIWFVRTHHRPKTRIGRMEAAAARFPPGTRAFEASMSVQLIEDLVAARERELERTADPEREALLTRQIANLRQQSTAYQAIVDARDLSPGKGSIGVDPDSGSID